MLRCGHIPCVYSYFADVVHTRSLLGGFALPWGPNQSTNSVEFGPRVPQACTNNQLGQFWSGIDVCPEFGQSWPAFDQLWSELCQARPNLARHRPNMFQIRSKVARNRPVSAMFGPDTTNIGPKSANSGPTSAKHGLPRESEVLERLLSNLACRYSERGVYTNAEYTLLVLRNGRGVKVGPAFAAL